MADISNFAFDGTDVTETTEGFKNTSNYTDPTSESEVRKQLQMPLSQLRKYINETIVPNVNKGTLFLATYTLNSAFTEVASCDKTFAEIKAVLDAGKPVVAKTTISGYALYGLINAYSSSVLTFIFAIQNEDDNYSSIQICHTSSDTFTMHYATLLTSNYIVTAMPTTALDTNVPSTKLVKDQLATKQATLTAGENITIENNVISAGGGRFIATYTYSNGSITACDKTYSEITTAINAGKNVGAILNISGTVFHGRLSRVMSEGIVFELDTFTSDDATVELIAHLPSNTYELLNIGLFLSNNVNTTMPSSPSDEKVPSTKLLNTQLANKVDKVSGKGLSTNDYSNSDLSKMNSLKVLDITPVTSQSGGTLTISKENYETVTWDIDFSGREEKTNKVTSISSSSTDTQYPSAKLVYDKLATKQDLISSPTANNIVLTNARGQVIDSGYSIDDVAKTNPKTWKDVQDVVRLGLGELKYPVGSTFTVNITGLGDTVWTVMHHIHNGNSGSIHLKNGLQHGMILQARDVLYYGLFPYDEKEAFYCNEEAMSVGTFNFLLGQHSWVSGDVGKYFQFTTNVTIPADAQFVFQQAYNVTLEGASVKIYASGSSTTVLDTVTLTEGQGGTYLGELRNNFSGDFNSCQRGFFGNNRWKESFERQFLNSDLSGNFFTAQNKWDRIHSYQSNSGFMYRLPTEFKNVIGEVNLDTVLNTVCDGGGIETTSDKIILPSRTEVYGGQENTSDNGVAWQQYINAIGTSSPTTSATDGRVKVSIGTSTARYWWWRSPTVGNAGYVRRSSTTGAVDSIHAHGGGGVSPACVIC